MAIISKNMGIQENLLDMYDSLLSERNKIQKELAFSRLVYKVICEQHIHNNFAYEKAWLTADQHHYNKFIEYDMYCHMIEIINDFKDVYGHFPEYREMHLTLHQVMLRFAEDEKYEIAAIVKVWVDKIERIINHDSERLAENAGPRTADKAQI